MAFSNLVSLITKTKLGLSTGKGPPGPTRASAPPAGGASPRHIRRHLEREGEEGKGGRRRRRRRAAAGPLAPGAVARSVRRTRGRERREREGGEKEKRKLLYIFDSLDSDEKREKQRRIKRS
jgi:hypothetical protein